MAISAKSRKLLWGRCGGVCAICRCPLTEDSAADDPHIVIGTEAHIVSGDPARPRHRSMPSAEVDAYQNLILLCPNDHMRVDKQVRPFTEQRLLDIKSKHETWVKRLASEGVPAQTRLPPRGGRGGAP